MSCALTHTLIVTVSGKIYGIGDNSGMKLIEKPTNNKSSSPILTDWKPNVRIIKVCCGFRHTHLLDENGNVWSAGNSSTGSLGIGNVKGELISFCVHQISSERLFFFKQR